MPSINQEWCEITRDVIKEAQVQLTAQLVEPLVAELPGISVHELASDFFKKMQELQRFTIEIANSSSSPSSERPLLSDALVPLFKALFLRARLAKARQFDQQRSKTTNPQIIGALEEKLKVYDGVIREEWFQTAVPEYPPSLQEMLTLERVEQLDTETYFPKRQYDEKFHLLQAPALFLPDLHYYRSKCGARNLPVAIAFMDIDKFKDFNTTVGHTNVNRHVLPPFMRSVETHIYGHGYAYRMSGDEYALLMPNADADLAMTFMSGLRKRITELRFQTTTQTITLSIGLCVADRNCFLTDEELLQKAEQAMNFAKNAGRNRVAGYSGKLFDPSELRLLLSTEASGL
jgi:diguanylate cyclase (GGDEF)-like protein